LSEKFTNTKKSKSERQPYPDIFKRMRKRIGVINAQHINF